MSTPQNMNWLRNKTNNLLLRTFIFKAWRKQPDECFWLLYRVMSLIYGLTVANRGAYASDEFDV